MFLMCLLPVILPLVLLPHVRIHLELGVSHLTDADEKVLQMKSELQQLQPQVLEKAEVCNSVNGILVVSSLF